jgi:uncharacterized membrane protein
MLLDFLAKLPSELYVFLISMLPFIELRGAIPVGAALGMPFYTNFPIAIIGNMLPVPLILLLMPKILDFLGRFKFFRPIVDWLRRTADKHSKKVIKDEVVKTDEAVESAENKVEGRVSLMTPAIFVALMLFVALPIPGTGAWSGSLVAALFSLSKRYSFLAVFLGVLICGVIMSLASYGVLEFLSFLL